MRRLVTLSEAQLRNDALTESGTNTTDLPPSTNAVRQMQQDMATTGKEGIPTPLGATPGEQSAANIPAQLDPNGEDKPAQIDPMYAKNGETSGMQIPADVKPALDGPGSDTMAPGSDTSVGVPAEIAKAKAKSGLGLRLESMTAEDVVDFLIESFGGVEAFVFNLVADNCPFDLAEALAEGSVDFADIDDRIIARLYEMAVELIGDTEEAIVIEGLDKVDARQLIDALIAEGLGDTVRGAVQKLLGQKKEPSDNFKKSKEQHAKRIADRKSLGTDAQRRATNVLRTNK